MKLSVDQRFWMVKRRLAGADASFICEQLDISRDTFYRFWRRFQVEGWSGLGLKSHRPKNVHRTPQPTIDLILDLRRNKGWGPARIEGYLRQEKPEGIMPVGHNTIYRVIQEADLNNPLEEPRKTWGKKRFQRTEPNQMWQTDWKLTKEDEWMITYLDDYSRFIPGSKVFHNATTENALKVLKEALDSYGTPQQILSDQGVQFYTWQEGGKTEFTKFLERRGIQHIVASKRRPTTTGKVERFNRSYDEEAWRYPSHMKYIHHYNYERPHQALKYLTPATLYFKEV